MARRLELGDLAEPGPASVAEPSTGQANVVEDAVDRILSLGLPIAAARKLMTTEFEQRYLSRILAEHGGVAKAAAAASGIARRHFHRLRRKGT